MTNLYGKKLKKKLSECVVFDPFPRSACVSGPDISRKFQYSLSRIKNPAKKTDDQKNCGDDTRSLFSDNCDLTCRVNNKSRKMRADNPAKQKFFPTRTEKRKKKERTLWKIPWDSRFRESNGIFSTQLQVYCTVVLDR